MVRASNRADAEALTLRIEVEIGVLAGRRLGDELSRQIAVLAAL